MKKLGAFGFELGAVASFFESPWSRVSPALNVTTQSIHLNYAAFTLRTLGRLTESLEPMRVSGERPPLADGSRRPAKNLVPQTFVLSQERGPEV